MERNGLSEITPSPKPHKKNFISQKHKVRNDSCLCLDVVVVLNRINLMPSLCFQFFLSDTTPLIQM